MKVEKETCISDSTKQMKNNTSRKNGSYRNNGKSECRRSEHIRSFLCYILVNSKKKRRKSKQ